jgi:hypothetical protein
VSLIIDQKVAQKAKEQHNHDFSSMDYDIKADLDTLGQLLGKIDALLLLQDSFQSPDAMVLFQAIGELLAAVAWNEREHQCVRNQHGLRNRHKNKSNQLNENGAKIDFEVLCRLSELKPDYLWLFYDKKEPVRKSLNDLRDRIQHVLNNATHPLTSSETYLQFCCSYMHDVECCEMILEILRSNEAMIRDIDLNKMLHRYYLGYYFCAIGELAKEMSVHFRLESEKGQLVSIRRTVLI